jgi:hypothetical protein
MVVACDFILVIHTLRIDDEKDCSVHGDDGRTVGRDGGADSTVAYRVQLVVVSDTPMLGVDKL